MKKYIPSTITIFSMILTTSLLMMFSFSINVYLVVLFIATICDTLDGYVARKLNVASEFGRKMDAFHDFYVYGALAAITVMVAFKFIWIVVLASICYAVLVGLRQSGFFEQKNENSFVGIPSNAATFVIMCGFSVNVLVGVISIFLMVILSFVLRNTETLRIKY